MSEIDQLIKQKTGEFDDLNKFSKDEIFKKVDFYDVTNEKFVFNKDEESNLYHTAGFWKKFENFTRFGRHKEQYNLIKSKERGLLDKTDIDESMLNKEFNITSQYAFSDPERVIITKKYEYVDGKIVKMLKVSRTESGAVEAAGEMREDKINQLERVNGAELVGLKESMKKNAESRKNISNLMGVMSEEEKEKLNTKLNEEEIKTKEKIKEKEEEIAEELSIFKEPLDGRLKETMEIENILTNGLDFIKTEETKLNKQIKEYEDYIKQAQKERPNLLSDVGGDIVKILEGKKAIADSQAKGFAESKALIVSKLETLKNNKKEIHNTLFRINDIGKTEEEKDKEIKEDQNYYENEIKNKSETKTRSTEKKKGGTKSADTKKDKDDERDNEYKFKKFREFFERFKEKFPVQGEQITRLFDPTLSQDKFKEIVDQINLREQPSKEGVYDSFYYEIGNRGRSLTIKYFKNGGLTVSAHFEDILADKDDNKEKNKETWDKDRDEAWGLKTGEEKPKSQKAGNFNEIFPTYGYPGRGNEKAENKEYKGGSGDKENQKKEELLPTKDILHEYLAYQDTFVSDIDKKSMLERTIKSESANKYAKALQEIISTNPKEKIELIVSDMLTEAYDILKKIGVIGSPFLNSKTWAMWDIGKQYYFATHPDEADKRYEIVDPLKSSEKITEIVDRHIGWEVYHAKNKEFMKNFGKHPLYDKLSKFLEKAPKSSNGDLSSKDLARLGSLIRRITKDIVK